MVHLTKEEDQIREISIDKALNSGFFMEESLIEEYPTMDTHRISKVIVKELRIRYGGNIANHPAVGLTWSETSKVLV